MRFALILSFFVILSPVYAMDDFDTLQLQERIKPIGKVRVEGQKANATPTLETTEVIAADKAPGQAVYENHCVVCHGQGIAGAPKFRVEADWQARLAKGKLDGLVITAMKGLNAMPAKGTCTECSEDDIKKAIQYMLPKK